MSNNRSANIKLCTRLAYNVNFKTLFWQMRDVNKAKSSTRVIESLGMFFYQGD